MHVVSHPRRVASPEAERLIGRPVRALTRHERAAIVDVIETLGTGPSARQAIARILDDGSLAPSTAELIAARKRREWLQTLQDVADLLDPNKDRQS